MAYYIDEDNYYKRSQPAKTEEQINTVQVPASPLVEEDYDDQIYKGDPETFTALESKTIEIKYSTIPILDAEAKAYIVASSGEDEGELLEDEGSGEISNTEATITSVIYYAWGASLTISNPVAAPSDIVIVVGGTPLKAKGDQIPEATDPEGIVENGVLKYKLQKNHLIQSYTLGQDIADTLLASYSIARKDVNLDWRGNLCLRLMDEIETIEYNKGGILTTDTFYIYKQVTTFDGTLKQNTDGRKIL